MAKPRVFVSSTYYDLKHIRRNMELFIEDMGYEPVLFESGDIPFEDTVPIDISCYKEIENCHVLILVIGGKYGSPASGGKKTKKESKQNIDKQYEFYNSVTKNEFIKAREAHKAVFVFVEKGVKSEYDTYKKNRKNKSIKYAHVDSINVFRLLDGIFNEKNIYVKDFDNFDEIQSWLKEQWAGLFANYLSKNNNINELKNLSVQVTELSNIVSGLKDYTEAIMRQVKPKDYEKIIKDTDQKLNTATKYSELLAIPYIKHLNHTHNFKIELINDLLFKAKTFHEFKEELFKVDGGRFGCINGNNALRDLNLAREIIGVPEFIYTASTIRPLSNEQMLLIQQARSRNKNKGNDAKK